MSLQEERIRQAGRKTGAKFQKLDVKLVHLKVFKCEAQIPRIPLSPGVFQTIRLLLPMRED